MSALALAPPTFVLVEPPGVVRAASAELAAIGVGEDTKLALGVTWPTLLELGRDARVVITTHGRFRVAPLTDGAGHVSAILLFPDEASLPAASSFPPPSSTRFVPDLAAVAGKDTAARAAVDLALRFARTMLPIYIAGEEGSGADVLAASLVRVGGRSDAPLRRISASNAAEVNQLFPEGGVPFSGGTLLIEDAHLLSPQTGARLARELDRGIYADTHFVATGAGDLRDRVAKGQFAVELLTIVRSSTVSLPALRDREDLDHLVMLALAERSKHLTDIPPGTRGAKLEIRPEALARLREHSWPGNLRELNAWLERAVAAAAPATVLGAEHFPFEAAERTEQALGKNRVGLRKSAERAALDEALRAAAGNVSVASKKLGVARSTLYRLMLRHGIVR